MRRTQAPELIVALDAPDVDTARSWVRGLDGLPILYKVGLELFCSAGPDFVRELVDSGKRVFLDLKFHDIPNTVAKAAVQAQRLGVEIFTLHLAGGRRMVDQVRHELAGFAKRPKVIGVTVLTSFDDSGWGEVTRAISGTQAAVADAAPRLIQAGLSWGVDGVVCSAHELEGALRSAPGTFTVVPGIRPAGVAAGDQARIVTPAAAARLGASSVVVGRPIHGAPDPRAAAEAILAELGSAARG